ncbi:unnamed protein product [marine sediment metagenome]|uniref:Uncharacterized protein n=1 Tax=marine sediment metagenome TaxID=412755 RepID=X1KVZ7_9ZZZZ
MKKTIETKTIRVSVDTIAALKKYGGFGDNWNDCIQNCIDKNIKLKQQLKHLRQMKQKKQKTRKKQKSKTL